MKLQKSTKINSVLFRDENHKDILVFSSNLNISFENYLSNCKKPLYNLNGTMDRIPTSINQMLNFEYTLVKSITDRGHTFNLYEYKDNRFTSSFIELK